MPMIKTLPDDVARRIAAGEVVERPASVVKELIENAVDAGARNITVVTTGAGETLIEVRDDGAGMSRPDVVLAPRNFTTSKITDVGDLERIATYGFRGEALASISAVSRFEIISSDNTSGEGWRVIIEGRDAVVSEPAPHERGTTVRVRDLFFNTPARKRFLKSAITERRRILETILSFALILPDVEVHYVDDSRHVLDLLPAGSWRERVAAVLGADAMKHMVEVDMSAGTMQVRGFVSLPGHTRGNRNQQFYFVNRRSVREKTLVHSLQDAYRNVIPYKRFPVAVLSLEVHPEDVDVNVHPTKMEVRVRNDRQLFSLVRHAVKASLTVQSESSLSVSAAPSAQSSDATGSTRESVYAHPAGPTELFESRGSSGQSADVISLQDRIQDVRSEYGSESARALHPNPQLSLQTTEPTDATKEAIDSLRGKGLGDEGLFWQYDNTYIFIQVRGGLIVIDQHAAHERIIYDNTQRQLEGQAPPSQQILFSIHLELSLSELEVFRGAREMFRSLGFDLEPFGGKSILVRGYPSGLKNWDEGRLLLLVFDDVLQERVPGDTLRSRIVASFACRSAIKAGQKLSVEEMRLLADQLFAIENPYSCPHGRPTIHRLTTGEIGRWFDRH